MRRRKFLTGLLAGLVVSAARAQQRVRIVILHSGFPNRTPIHQLFEALSKLGLENGRTATIDLLGGEGDPNRLNALVAHYRDHFASSARNQGSQTDDPSRIRFRT